MIFNSLEFLLFLPLVAIMYFGLAARFRWLLLLLSSYFFYAYWNDWYLLLLLLSTGVSYSAAILIEKQDNKKRRRLVLSISIALSLGLLFFFKYFNFFSEQLLLLSDLLGFSYTSLQHSMSLPLGISFFTFQTISYSIDVYKGRMKAERHLGKYALYISFFAQLAAGPIERAKHLLPQFHGRFVFDYKRTVEGLQLILWGFFKKIVIADRLGRYVQEVYQNPELYQGSPIWIATAFFVFQIFCDFSAYSDIAIGSARIFGINLSLNFGNSPYFSSSFTQFWEKWHITLTRWVRDYIYMPLARVYRHDFQRPWLWLLVFLLIGLWHGANWTFVAWGGLNGFYLVVENKLRENQWLGDKLTSKTWWTYVAPLIVFALTAFSAVFFMAGSLTEAVNILQLSFGDTIGSVLLFGEVSFTINILAILFLEGIHYQMKDQSFYDYLGNKKLVSRWAFYVLLLNAILFLRLPEKLGFLYFDF